MAPVIWGLDLAEIRWGKFANSNMWNNKYHLRRTKFIMYQLAMILCVVSESLGTAALSNYVDAQTFVRRQDSRAHVHNNNYIGAASYNIFAGVFNAFIFGAAFFFDLFWPERYESKNVRIAWKACAVLATIFVCASAFTLTIITATKEAYISGVPEDVGRQINARFHKEGGAPLAYRDSGRAIAAVVFIWPGFVCTLASCVILFYSIDHWEVFGPKSTHERQADAAAEHGAAPLNGDIESGMAANSEKPAEDLPRRPESAHRPSDSTTLNEEERTQWAEPKEFASDSDDGKYKPTGTAAR